MAGGVSFGLDRTFSAPDKPWFGVDKTVSGPDNACSEADKTLSVTDHGFSAPDQPWPAADHGFSVPDKTFFYRRPVDRAYRDRRTYARGETIAGVEVIGGEFAVETLFT